MEGRMDDFRRRQALKRRHTSMSSTLSVSQETTMDADDVPDAQATDRTPDEQLVINATEELSRRGSPSSEQQLESRVKELEKELEIIPRSCLPISDLPSYSILIF